MNDNFPGQELGKKIKDWEQEAPFPGSDRQQLWQQLQSRLPEAPQKKTRRLYLPAAAACLLIMCSLAIHFARNKEQKKTAHSGQDHQAPAVRGTTINMTTGTKQALPYKILKPEHIQQQQKMAAAKRSSRRAAPSVSVSAAAETMQELRHSEIQMAPEGLLSEPIILTACYDDQHTKAPELLCY